MTTVQAPVVQVRVTEDLRVEFISTRRRVKPVRLNIRNLGRVAEARHELHLGLTEVKDLLTSLDVADNTTHALAGVLGRTGRRMTDILFHHPRAITDLQDFWAAAVPAWRNDTYAPVVECIGDEDRLLPLEFLPLFDMYGCDQGIGGRADFVRACRSFIGFSCVVRRHVPTALDGRNHIFTRSDGRLTMRYLHDESLPGSIAERAWLTSDAPPRVMLLGPYPDALQTTAELAKVVISPDAEPEAVQHFSCHCDTSAAHPMDYELRLSGCGNAVTLTLRDLYDARRERNAVPLVFLNACGGSRVSPVSSLSFPELFMKNGSRGFVGAEMDIPDDEAAAFSVAFYNELLLRRSSFGVAALRARSHLLRRHGNPIGLAYSVYGNTDLTVTRVNASHR